MNSNFRIKQCSDIYVGCISEVLPKLLPQGRVVVVTDANIDRLYHALLAPYDYLLIGTGETIKTLRTVDDLYNKFIELGVDRSTFILAIGGGIVTDIVGFVASTYMRGLKFGFVSTTLLGQIDASIGGKNGINIQGYKNMVGVFNLPQFVLCDVNLLQTLPQREFRAGLAELIKVSLVGDRTLFEQIEQTSVEALRREPELLSRMVTAAIRVKVGIVERDEFETGDRRLLNLGHTLAHAIEKCSSKMNHGEAVAVGLHLVSRAAVALGLLSADEGMRITHLLDKFGFVLTPPVEVRKLLQAIQKDKKWESGNLFVVLPALIGRCEVRKMPLATLESLLKS
ncbi:MAG: 3-dehydroquinate synthase [Alistipes sp.]